MKKNIILLSLLILSLGINAQSLKPYILSSTNTSSVKETSLEVKAALKSSNFNVVGEYSPVSDPGRWVIIVSHPALTKAVQSIAGKTGFAATLRVAITKESQGTVVSYTNPLYWGNAYFRDDFDKVASNYDEVAKAFKSALANIGKVNNTSFGSEKGEEIDDLRKYHYMMGMPYFDDTKELGEFSSYNQALNKIESSISKGMPGLTKVYRLDIPGQDLTLYGFALGGENGESKFMPKIDVSTPKHTAFLPYEILVMGNEVHMLHGRFRIALSFPDLTMGTFTKIMSSPGDIEDLLKQLVED